MTLKKFVLCCAGVCSVIHALAAAEKTISQDGVWFTYDPSLFSKVEIFEAKPKVSPAEGPESGSRRPAMLGLRFYAGPDSIGSIGILSVGDDLAAGADYPYLAKYLAELRTLLRDKPNLRDVARGTHEEGAGLPTFPFPNAGQTFLTKLRYLSLPWGEAISYLAQYAQDRSQYAIGYDYEFKLSRLSYEIHGLTGDGAISISAHFPMMHPRLKSGENQKLAEAEHEIMTDEQYIRFLSRMERILDKEPDESFTPSIATLDRLIASIRIDMDEVKNWSARFADQTITIQSSTAK